MAKPRIFISSTYYDLKSLRTELERFVRDSGYDPILNERGHVTYSKETSPEQSCYREIASSDILVSIIGGKFGSSSFDKINSISQVELKTAIEQNKQVYIFVQSDVYSEYRTWYANKKAVIDWTAVNNVKVYEFLEEIFKLPANNAVMPFETGHDIVTLLREQWAGLFQRLLQESTAQTSLEAARELRQGIDTVRQLIDVLSLNKTGTEKEDSGVSAILLPNHPAFIRIRKLLKVPYRVYFTNLSELNRWLKTRSFNVVPKVGWDSPLHMEWIHNNDGEEWDLLKISVSLFDNDERFVPDKVEWHEELITREVRPREYEGDDPSDE